jgi:hypothetical protein
MKIWNTTYMNIEDLMELIPSIIALFIAVGGWIVSYNINAKLNKLTRLEKSNKKLKDEVYARIRIENEACQWLADLQDRTRRSIKLELRTRTETKYNIRPNMHLSDL